MRFNKDKFFDEFRAYYKRKTGKKSVSVAVANGVDFLLDGFASEPKWNDIRHIAYAFSTITHETAWTYQPIKEYRSKVGSKGRANQDRYWLSGYYGRGYVQLTWLFNYKKAADKLKVDLVKNPDLALRADIAFKILTFGMHEGWFTGKKLSDYINAKTKDYKNARRIINGVDHAALLAQTANDFELMLRASVDNSPVKEIEEEVVEEGLPLEEPLEEETINEPVDGYPEEPKPGEAMPDNPAKEGEPVVGGRPGDTPVAVEETQPKETSGWGTWVSNIRAQWTALGIGGLSFGSVFSGFIENPTIIQWLLILGVAVIVIGGIIFLVSIILKHLDKNRREVEAHERTLKEMEINADPTKYNVKVISGETK